jgi:predicted nuclease of predicted toxin-antitoxin system
MIWLDAHLSPALAPWITRTFSMAAEHIRTLGLRDSEDDHIFQEARKQDAIIITKDSDFVDLVLRLGAPPKVIWWRSGNTTNERLQRIFDAHLRTALALLEGGDSLVEIIP